MENQNPTNPPESNMVNPSDEQLMTASVNKTNLLLPILITFLASAVIFGIGGYYVGSQLSNTSLTNENTIAATPKPSSQVFNSSTPSESPELNSDWKTYTDSDKNFSFQYPADWTVVDSDNSKAILKIIKYLPENSVDERYCRPGITDGGTDCNPEVWIELSIVPKPSGYISIIDSSPYNAFGEGLAPGREEFVEADGANVKLDYIREDSYYPSYSFVDLENEILRFRAYVPSSKNCIGSCPKYDDSQIVKDSAGEIKTIISTFKVLTD